MGDEDTTSDWIYLDIDTEAYKTEKLVEGFSVSVTPSPYDVPGAMKSDYDRARGRLHIQFQYISEEPLRRVPDDAGISLGVGKNSGRLYEIDVNLNQAEVQPGFVTQRLADRITEKINNFETQHTYPARVNNYRIATAAVELQKDRLFSSLPTEASTIAKLLR